MKPIEKDPNPTRSPSGAGAVGDVAAEWLALREFGFSAEEQAEFSQWLLSDPRHEAAVQQIDSAWRFMRKVSFTGQTAAAEEEVERRLWAISRRNRRQVVGLSLMGVAAAAVLAFAYIPHSATKSAAPSVHAGSVQIRPERQVLPDGSIVNLNAEAQIAIEFTSQWRNVRLVRGEAQFIVAKNAARPFVVTAGTVVVRAVGTEFAVRFDPLLVGILVTEGRVLVEQVAAAVPNVSHTVKTSPIFLGAGDELDVPVERDASAPLQVHSMMPADIERALAWRNMRVEFTNTPLGEVVDMFNSQNHQQLALKDASLAQIGISGIFWANDPEGFSRLIEASAGLKAVHDSDGRIILVPQ